MKLIPYYVVLKKTVFAAIFLLITAWSQVLSAQTVSGKVTDSSTGEALIGATITEDGTRNGTTSDIQGAFRINVSKASATLIVTYVGYETQRIALGGKTSLEVGLSASATLNEVVVTALGISREKKSLSYSATEVSNEEINRVKDANFVNSLSGKVAGVQINRSGSGVGGSTRVVLRGNKSTRDNNVLYVIDGIPMFNYSPAQPSDIWGQAKGSGSPGFDGGDAISNLNPDDIESSTVLKGASAAALYGSQAANGVILITTKKGKAGQTKVNYSSNLTFENPITLPELQFSYKQTKENALDSWGDKGTSTDHVKDFFQTGSTFINTLSLSGGNNVAQSYFSFAHTGSKGIIPTSKFERYNLNFRESAVFFDNHLTVNGNVNLINQSGENRQTSGLYNNPLTGLYFFPRGLDFQRYADNYETFSPARNTNVQNWIADQDNQQNPWWILNRVKRSDARTRVMTTVSAVWKFNEHWSFQMRGSGDKAFDKSDLKAYASTQTTLADANGRYTLSKDDGTSYYGDALLMYNRPSDKVSFNAVLGSSIFDTRLYSQFFDSKDGDLKFANVFSIQNMKQPATISETLTRQQLQSVFGSAQVGFRNMVYVDVTGRNDWSSTLAQTSSTSFFYPSVGLTGILSEMFKVRGIDFAKVRLSYAQVGNGVSNYDVNPINSINSKNGLNVNTVGPLPGTELKPELSKSLEAGLDFRTLNNRLGIDLTYYKSNTTNQRLAIAAPSGTGFTSYIINAGDIQNSGIEAMLSFAAIRKTDFEWNTNVNFTKNVNKVISLDKRLSDGTFVINGAGVNNYAMVIKEGGQFGDIQGKKFMRDASGNIMVDATKKPISGAFDIVGNPNPNFMLGWNNSFRYKKISVNFLIDGRFGGKVMSITQAMLDELGVSKASADARDAGGIDVGAVLPDGSKAGKIDAKQWYQSVGGRAGFTENYVYDATNIRLRELAVGYSFPKIGKLTGIKLSVVGRNLFFLSKKAPFDPEVSMSTGTGLQGVDSFAPAATRSLGLNLNLTF
ncbi:MAG: SusC/RagA family TonB-linked outer membrane protein [Bacteroidota bacterium]